MQLQAVELVGDGVVGAGQETGADAPGALAKPQVKARRLYLVVIERPRRCERAACKQLADLAIRKDSRTHARTPLMDRSISKAPD